VKSIPFTKTFQIFFLRFYENFKTPSFSKFGIFLSMRKKLSRHPFIMTGKMFQTRSMSEYVAAQEFPLFQKNMFRDDHFR